MEKRQKIIEDPLGYLTNPFCSFCLLSAGPVSTIRDNAPGDEGDESGQEAP